MDGTRLMGRWADLTGKPHPLSTATHILQYAQEFRGALGHIGMIGMREFILPFIGGAGGTAYAQPRSSTPIWTARGRRAASPASCIRTGRVPRTPPDGARARSSRSTWRSASATTTTSARSWSDELGSADFYYRLLNAGFRIAATGGTDNFSDVWLDPPPGSDRTFVQVRDR